MDLLSKKLAVCLTAAVACGAEESAVPQHHLPEPDAAYPEALGMVQTVRPLPDGRALVADPLGQVLVAIDMDAGTADTIGRRGAGPGEYDQPDAVFPLPGDSTLLVDLGNGRLSVLGPDLEHGSTMPLAFGDPQRGDMTFILPRGTDQRGRLYFQGMGIRMGGPGLVEFPDSAAIMRFDRPTNTIDTLGMILLRRREAFTTGTGPRQQVEVAEYALSPEDAWHVSPTGRVAAARTDGYYVEWIEDDGSHPGPNVPYTGVPVRRADQDEWINDFYAMSMSLQVRVVNNVRTTSFSRGGPGSDDRPGPEGFEWPDTKPPFIANGLRVSPSGEAWVQRSIPAGSDVVYDVFDADGNRTEQVIFLPERRVVGFAGEFLYVVRKDEFDLFWLERYRLAT
jgi:hypothetical protein